MNDMSSVIVAKSDQINAEDLVGKTVTVTIEGVTIRGGQEQPVSIKLKGFDKVWRPCKTVCRILTKVWGLDAKQYVGKSVTLYHDPTVKYGGLPVGGIRVSHMSHIHSDTDVVVQATRGAFKSIRIKPLRPQAQQSNPADAPTTDPRAEALAYVEWYEDQVRNAPDMAALDALDKQEDRTFRGLKRAFPDLYERATNFRNGAGTGAHVPEGRPDSDFGETFNEDHPHAQD